MKFAIPMAEGKLTAHFGHCQEFALIDANDKQMQSLPCFRIGTFNGERNATTCFKLDPRQRNINMIF